MRSKLGVAIIGTGEWAQAYHLPALQFLQKELSVEIIGIWNRTYEKAEQTARAFGIGHVYREFDEVLNDARIDCHVVLVNSTASHDILVKLAARGLPVFTEKPAGNSVSEAEHLARIMEAPNVVAFNRRYMPISRRFIQLAREIENPYFAECHFYRSERFIEHFIKETGIHGINFMEYLCGPIAGLCTEKIAIPSGKANLWICSIKFESGMHGIIKFMPASGSSIERYEFHGQVRSIYLHCPQTYTSDHPGAVIIHEGGKQKSVFHDDEENQLASAGFLDEYRDFFRSVREGTETVSNFRNAANTMRIAQAIQESGGNDGMVALSSLMKIGNIER